MASQRAPVALIILDGWGLREETDNNAVKLANPAVFTKLWDTYPHATLQASGEAVGLPAGQMGNSEVGHTNLGAGRTVYQDLTRIDKAISDGTFAQTPALRAAISKAVADGTAVHFLGLLSDGGVHSHQEHLHALLRLAKALGAPKVFVHVITDGRDTSPTGGRKYVRDLEAVLAETGAKVASVSGRYYAMDRDKRWERVKLAYDAIVTGTAPHGSAAATVIEESYSKDITDEFILPATIVDAAGQPVGPMADGDQVIFFNFRADRARQIIRALLAADFDGFPTGTRPTVQLTTFTEYDATYPYPIAFPPQPASQYFGEVLQAHGLTNMRLAETEKYPHVTYFFNGGVETPFTGEDRVLLPSPKVATYDLQPEMSASGVADAFVDSVADHKHDVIICNFANPDMVGHTGKLEAAIAAITAVDACLGRAIDALLAAGGTALVTADHGNAEQMWDYELNAPHTAHTTNLVPVVLVGPDVAGKTLHDGALTDVAPTLLSLLGITQPAEMTGKSLID
ncbi:MAG TPA: 2,3-bisphosphoglycerate-independent phosphoglycerate mutase [Luteitalea sp.]|nr:2,3-bisphosphoglycerate-independent phosphoglycerate mutase [Luteitalea sp.]